MADDEVDASTRPVLRVVRGEPDADELAVLTALMQSRGGAAPAAAEPPRRGRWNDPAWAMRSELRPGAGAWSNSLR